MNLLVTGRAGFVASSLVRLLVNECCGVIVNVDKLTYAADLNRLKNVEDNRNYRFVEGNVCDQKLMRHLMMEHRINACYPCCSRDSR